MQKIPSSLLLYVNLYGKPARLQMLLIHILEQFIHRKVIPIIYNKYLVDYTFPVACEPHSEPTKGLLEPYLSWAELTSFLVCSPCATKIQLQSCEFLKKKLRTFNEIFEKDLSILQQDEESKTCENKINKKNIYEQLMERLTYISFCY